MVVDYDNVHDEVMVGSGTAVENDGHYLILTVVELGNEKGDD